MNASIYYYTVFFWDKSGELGIISIQANSPKDAQKIALDKGLDIIEIRW